ncbi:response regulator [Roseitranquillus sediminis]|uniref:response regulator n=1 Tax=Roseitranquillus sediminis TaxID=2809051 RepID=UPI001D0C8DC0|nr:response regulator [Roseitranquillus sediminis]MBM9593637.1 response regulator [Roseitranquillus sediminis]
MQVLIVQPKAALADLWRRALERRGAAVRVATTQHEAIDELQRDPAVDVVVLDLVLPGESAFAVADYASYRRPDAKVIFVTDTSFFSDGSIFRHIPNACAFMRAETSPEDLVAIVEHFSST